VTHGSSAARIIAAAPASRRILASTLRDYDLQDAGRGTETRARRALAGDRVLVTPRVAPVAQRSGGGKGLAERHVRRLARDRQAGEAHARPRRRGDSGSTPGAPAPFEDARGMPVATRARGWRSIRPRASASSAARARTTRPACAGAPPPAREHGARVGRQSRALDAREGRLGARLVGGLALLGHRSMAGAVAVNAIAALRSAATAAVARRGSRGISMSFGGVQVRSHAPRASQRDACTEPKRRSAPRRTSPPSARDFALRPG
jgi:hypothetical protein